MSETITMNKELLTEVMAQAMALSAQRTMGLPSRAAGEQSNIANRTEFYGLPLPTGNEIVAYQDFINDANNIIDAAMHSIQNTLDTVSTTATNAADGVEAADTKIQELVQANIDNQSASLPQFKEDTEVRLETLEDDVASFQLPVNDGLWTNNLGTPLDSQVVKFAPFGLYIANIYATAANQETIPTKKMRAYTGTDSSLEYKHYLLLKHSGNFFNLPEINTAYIFPITGYAVISGKPQITNGLYLSIMYNGVDTLVNSVVPDINTIYNVCPQYTGITKYPTPNN